MPDGRLHLLVEGDTERIISDNVFEPYWTDQGWLVTRSVVATKRLARGGAHRGGVSSWARLRAEIERLLPDNSLDVLTTMFDYYGFPKDAPGVASRPDGGPVERVEHIEQALVGAIGDQRFVPHLTLHETESWVFAAAEQLGEWYDDPKLAARLRSDADQAGGPELVNDGPATAPSKRLLSYYRDYAKTLDGPMAVAELGLSDLRGQCPHLDRWLTRIDSRLTAHPR